MKAVLFLQNAYSPAYAGKKWPRSSWLRALFKSHTGKRLKNLIEGMGIPKYGTIIPLQ